ncbi:CLUMA_CG010191, isoform A [Clunio marinus]|uniref:CLUMA_CG010191, isoform A n=1 Tax=Clunio marinus TaxID=568069 RepID=A0A1J1I8X6_9DIPT|nr:CLUMA_CG010191, isoform A [Clunio marinus]
MTSLFSLKLKDGKFQTSGLAIIYSAFTTLVTLIYFVYMVLVYTIWREELESISTLETIKLLQISSLSNLTLRISMVLCYVEFILMILLNYSFRHEIRILLQKMYELPMTDENWKKFGKLCLHNLLRLIIFTMVLWISTQISFYNFSKKALVMCFLNIFTTLSSFNFFVSINNVETFIICLMEEFQIELNLMYDIKSADNETKVLIEFTRYYQNIVDIMEQFNKSFGMHLTSVISGTTLLIILFMDFLAIQIIQHDSCLKIFNLFIFDNKLALELLSIIASYTIVLIQFNIEEGKKK